ncbi:MAG TPA: molybdopterin-dependent oxidoreductase [Stellaceae bacterium]|nr:molybdopterin-dependent oxidoreductase [Stellaceae bacterium]
MNDLDREYLTIEQCVPHSSHWGAFSVRPRAGGVEIAPHPRDPDPSPLLANIPAAVAHRARIARPMIRRGWLDDGPGPDRRRGRDEFVSLAWPRALDLAAAELRRVYAQSGPQGVFGGSYGWASAGRFHDAQSQIHRFLNLAGGYVRSVNSYSSGAASVILPHVVGPQGFVAGNNVSWDELATESALVLAFGGMALKNNDVGGGGTSRHVARGNLRIARERGVEFHLISPLRDDLPAETGAIWHPIRPGTDVALMLGIAHTLMIEGRHDRGFLDRYCVGWPEFAVYLLGHSDGQPKDAAWAGEICGLPADDIVALARRAVGRRTLITCSQSLQRAERGEQPVWMGLVLAAVLGQIGLPGGGFAYALGSTSNTGKPPLAVPLPSLPQGRNSIGDFIPVARIADMLLNPGAGFDYNGRRLTYPDIRLLYWVGGNPFHHHQDLNRLRRAFARPETVIVHDSVWTASARHADIVLPATITLEREDIGGSAGDPLLVAMHRAVPRFAEARDDHEIFAELAERLGLEPAFTEGRSPRAWLAQIYQPTRRALLDRGLDAPDFERFWELGELILPTLPWDGGPLRDFRHNPDAASLPTPSGRIEITAAAITAFGYADCPGHPAWLPPSEAPGSAAAAGYPLWLIANQPATRLHSQLDFGATSQAAKIKGREPVRIHPHDAAARGIRDGDIVRLYNDRGACLAGAVISEALRPGVVQLSTGAWYDPDDPAAENPLCVHGNPNVLTRDIGTSRLAQGCTGQLTPVEIERFDRLVPPIRCFDPPPDRPADRSESPGQTERGG